MSPSFHSMPAATALMPWHVPDIIAKSSLRLPSSSAKSSRTSARTAAGRVCGAASAVARYSWMRACVAVLSGDSAALLRNANFCVTGKRSLPRGSDMVARR